MKYIERSALLTLLLAGVVHADRVRVVPREGTTPSRVERQVTREKTDSSVRDARPERNSQPERVRVVPRKSGGSHRDRNDRHDRYDRHSRGGGHSYPRHHYGHYPRYYGNHFYHHPHRWWYDPIVSHWTFWANGYWWWPGPGGVTYVYVNDGYYPYESSNVYVPIPEAPAAPPPETEKATKAPTPEITMKSPKGDRMVQIAGENAEAYLYDTTGKEAVFLKVLGTGVVRARFSGGTAKQPLQILIDYDDGRFGFFSASGNPIDPAKAQ